MIIGGLFSGQIAQSTGKKYVVDGAVVNDQRTATTTPQDVLLTTNSTVTPRKQAGKRPNWTTASVVSLTRRAGKLATWTTASALSATRAVTHALSWTTASALSAAKALTRPVAIATASALSVLKQATRSVAFATASTVSAAAILVHLVNVAFTTASAVSVATRSAFASAINLTTASALTLRRAIGKQASWTTASALSIPIQRGKLVAFVTTSTFSAAKAITRTFRFTTRSAITSLTFGHVLNAAVNITTSSVVSLRRSVGKAAEWTTSGLASLLASGGHSVDQLVAFTTASVLTARKQAQKPLALAITSTLAMTRRAGKVMRFTTTSTNAINPAKYILKAVAFTTHGALRAIKLVSHKVSWTTASSVGPKQGNNFKGASKARLATIVIATASALSLSRGVGKRVAISTVGLLRAVKAVTHTLIWTTTSTVRAGVIKAQEQIVEILVNSDILFENTVGKALAFTTDGLASLSNTAAASLQTAVASSVGLVREVGKIVEWTTVSIVSMLRDKLLNVLVEIVNVSTLALRTGVLRGVVVLITSTSVVSVLQFINKIGRPVITLFGDATRMLLYSVRNMLPLTSERPSLELQGMSTKTDGHFHAGETWLIRGVARDENRVPFDLTGGMVQLRIVSTEPNTIILDLATPTDGSITQPTKGVYEFNITPAQQTAVGMTLGGYAYEARATLSDGTVTVLNEGEITVEPSRFVSFP